MSEQERMGRIVDHVLAARQLAVRAEEGFLVELLDVLLLAAAERVVAVGDSTVEGPGIVVGRPQPRARDVRRPAVQEMRRRARS